MLESNTYYAGVDWARDAHCVYLATAEGERVGMQSFPHSGAGLRQMAEWLHTQTAGGSITATIEMPHGPVVTGLQHHGIAVHSINPTQLNHGRRQRAMSGAKDDARDARLMTEVARTTPESVRLQPSQSDAVIAVRTVTQRREQLVGDRTALIARLRDQLWAYFPALAGVAKSMTAAWFLHLCTVVPTPADAADLTATALDALLPKRTGRRPDSAGLLAQLQVEAIPNPPRATAAMSASMLTTVQQLQQINAAIAAADAELRTHMAAVQREAEQAAARAGAEAVLAEADPAAIARLQPGDLDRLMTVPGVGDVVLAQLIAYAHDGLARRDRRALRCLAGVAPVTLQSGRQCRVRMRRAANQHLRNAMHAMAATAAIRDPASKNYYQSLKTRGCSHGRACRAVADRLLRIIFAMLRDGTDFDPQRASCWLDVAAETKEENGAHEC